MKAQFSQLGLQGRWDSLPLREERKPLPLKAAGSYFIDYFNIFLKYLIKSPLITEGSSKALTPHLSHLDERLVVTGSLGLHNRHDSAEDRHLDDL